MEISEMKHSDIEQRLAEIQVELANEDSDVDALSAEVNKLEERESALRQEAEEKRALIEKVTNADVPVIEERKEETKMSEIEVRNSKAYVDAFANYVKNGSDAECRALLTENVSGAVPVPEFVYDIVKNAWEKQGIMALVRKTYMRGNLKVGFEISGDGAVKHTEGDVAIDPENLVLGTINIVPASIKKVVQISDEVNDLRGEEFLRYIYDELTYRIAKKCADLLLADIEACGTVSTTTQVGVPVLTATAGIGTIAQAMALLSDDASNPAVVMNKATWGAFKSAQATANYAYDPFEGLPVLFNNTITAYNVASTGDTFAIVGDFGQGAIANFPNGSEAIEFKFDDLSLKKQDLIEIMGRQYVGLGIVAPNAFVKIQK